MRIRTFPGAMAFLFALRPFVLAGDFEDSLIKGEQQILEGKKASVAAVSAPSAVNPSRSYHADRVLGGGLKEILDVNGTDQAGTRAILTRTVLIESINVSLATRGPKGWQEKLLITRAWGVGTDATLEVEGLSNDGRFALIGYREELKDPLSWSIRVLDVDSGEVVELSKVPREDTVFGRGEQFKAVVTASDWLKSHYNGLDYQKIFPRKDRGCGDKGVTLKADTSLILTSDEAGPSSHPLKKLIGAEVGGIGRWATVFGADCRSGFVVISELHDGSPGFTSVIAAVFSGGRPVIDPQASNTGYSRDHLVAFGPNH